MFRKARFRLTVWYLFIIMLVSISFSVVVYQILTRELDRFNRVSRSRIERRFHLDEFLPRENGSLLPVQPFAPDPELVEETKQRIIFTLILINGSILILSGGLGYILAGRTLAPIKDMVDEQNRFISDASHELRTPLTSLKSAMEVFLRDRKPTIDDAKILVKDSVTEVNKMQALSESLLALTQYQKPSSETKFKTLALPQIIKEAVAKIQPIARKKQIAIRTEIADLDVVGSKYSLVDLFVILLDNAIKYSPAKKEIAIIATKTDGQIRISVIDHGVGIEKKDIPHIFDRFYRADSARRRQRTGGYGLGLSIAKKIIDVHHGSITVESSLKSGSTFTVQLPIASS